MVVLKRIIAAALALMLLAGLTACNYQSVGPDTTPTSPADSDSTEPAEEQPTQPTLSDGPHACPEEDPYVGMTKAEFYASYTPACCNRDARYRSRHGFLSGSLEIPGQYAQEAETRPQSNGQYIRNTSTVYVDDGDTYVVTDHQGNEVMRIHRSGGYITLEEVAAYMYAFGSAGGSLPANYISKKSGETQNNRWGEYLRLNHSRFIGNTDRYPYEPELPDISGCGGALEYYEMDIGTTGTTTPGYAPKPYVRGNTITRGAARLVYARQDLNGNGVHESNEVYVFYTHNHYNDFREYLNYYGGWGEIFGNETGGGEYSSKSNANPTPYVPTAYAEFSRQLAASSQWKTAYLDFLEQEKDTHLSYALVYIDGDDIPELYLSGDCEATGDSICTYQNGTVVVEQLNRIGGGRYVERSGSIMNQNGNMGFVYTHVYKLTEDGFVLTFEALSAEHIEDLGNNEYDLRYEYSIGGNPVEEAEYTAAVRSAFDFDISVWLNENAVEYNAICQQITDAK